MHIQTQNQKQNSGGQEETIMKNTQKKKVFESASLIPWNCNGRYLTREMYEGKAKKYKFTS
jgi:hypothetical protein